MDTHNDHRTLVLNITEVYKQGWPEYAIYGMQYKNINNSEQMIFNLRTHDLCQNIYQSLKHPWKQLGMLELVAFKIVKEVHFLFHFQG